MAIAGEVEIAEPVARQDGRALGADVLRHRHRVRPSQLGPQLAQARDGLPDLAGLAERSDFEK